VKKVKGCRVDSGDGEIHFILQEAFASTRCTKFKFYKTAEIKKISKKDAVRSLLLFRE